jgi:hypothetical protein
MKRSWARYLLEEEFFNLFGYYYERNEDLQVIIKDKNNISYSEPWECKRDFVNCGCQMQTINLHSKPEVETKVKSL